MTIWINTSDVLDRAADWIETNGKAQGKFFVGTNGPSQARHSQAGACAVGAIKIAALNAMMGTRETTEYAARGYLSNFLGQPIVIWSDSHSQAEVVAGLRAAARQARK